MSDLAVIGLDGLVAGQLDIDGIERAFYQGKSLSNDLTSPEISMASLCVDSLNRLAAANHLNSTDIDLLIVSENNSDSNSDSNSELLKALESSCKSCTVVNQLGLALEKLSHLITISDDQSAVAAIIGISGKQTTISEQATISLDESFSNYGSTDGVASLLISSTENAATNNHYIYSSIKSFDTNSNIKIATSNAISCSGIDSDRIELLEISSLAHHDNAEQELAALIHSYSSTHTLQIALSCARSVIGESAGLSQVVGLLKTIIALQQHYIPGMSGWQKPNSAHMESCKNLETSAFYFPTESRPWYPNPNNIAHAAGYSCQTKDGYCHVIIEENLLADKSADLRTNGYFATSTTSLFLVSANSKDALMEQLEILEQNCLKISDSGTSSAVNRPAESLKKISHDCYQSYLIAISDKHEQDPQYNISIIAESSEELLKEITLAKIGILKALDTQSEWRTPRGSFFTALPVCNEDKSLSSSSQNPLINNVAFLYPGIGATYVGLGRDLFHLFPEIYQPVADLADDIGETLKDKLLNPRSIERLDFKTLKKLDSNLRNSLAHIAECGVGFACVFTKIFEEVFGIYADHATGYSMGEVSMYAALGCWQQPGLMSARLAQSETFNQRLSGELTTLRTLWNLPASNEISEDKIWETYSIRATADEVKEAAIGEDRVFTTIVNTPDNLLIGGYPEACERVIKKLGIRSMAMDMPNAIHSAPAQADYPDMEKLFTMDVTERIDTKMLSSSCYLPIPHRSRAIANSVAKCLCDSVDFPRLINALYGRGSRIFIEMGAGRSLCSWTDKILSKQGKEDQTTVPHNHASIPVNAKGTADELTYLRAVAKLVSHGVQLNLDRVFNGSIIVYK